MQYLTVMKTSNSTLQDERYPESQDNPKNKDQLSFSEDQQDFETIKKWFQDKGILPGNPDSIIQKHRIARRQDVLKKPCLNLKKSCLLNRRKSPIINVNTPKLTPTIRIIRQQINNM